MQQIHNDELRKAALGDPDALNRVMPLVYGRVREIASVLLAQDRAEQWVRASSLVHLAVIRLMDQRCVDFGDAARVTAVLATIMRRTVIDIARRELADKRGGSIAHVSLHSDPVAIAGARTLDALEVEDSLVALTAVAPDAARVAELRLWGGMEFDQIAAALDTSPTTVKRLWNRAKAWIARDLSRVDTPSGYAPEPV